MFKIFPCTITPDGRKVPLIKGWKEAATADPATHRLWQELFKERLKFWGVPTGSTNGIFVLDVDVKTGGLESMKRLQLPQTMFQRTMSGGLHFIYAYPNDGKVYGNRVGLFKDLPGLDTRGENGYILCYGFDNTPVAPAPQWLLDAAVKQPEAPQGDPVKVDPSIAENLIHNALENIRNAPEGESNDVLNQEAFKVGQLVASGSVSREYAEQALYQAAIERGKPAYESKATIASGLDGGARKPITSPFGMLQPVPGFDLPAVPVPERWTPAYFSRSDLLNHSALRKPQLFEDWSTEDIAITTADGGTGKTTLKLFEAICLALGERFLGFNCVQPGKTLFITGEDTAKKIAAMIGAIVRQIGLFEPMPGNSEKIQLILDSIVVKKDADLCLITKDRNTGFIHPNSQAFRKVLEAVDDVKPKLIVFDPISSFWGSEAALNDMNKAVTKFMSDLTERSGACVEMINHMGKSSSANKDMSQFAGRGGSGLPSNARVSRVLRSVFEDEYAELTGESLGPKQSAMMCNVNKFSDGSPLYNKPFLILRDGFIFTRKALTEVKAKEAEQNMTDMERVFGFIKEQRALNRYPTLGVVIGHFQTCGSPIAQTRIKQAVQMLQYQGHMGELLKTVENPDVTIKDKAFIITDGDGREV